jgi:hypothetical protein
MQDNNDLYDDLDEYLDAQHDPDDDSNDEVALGHEEGEKGGVEKQKHWLISGSNSSQSCSSPSRTH